MQNFMSPEKKAGISRTLQIQFRGLTNRPVLLAAEQLDNHILSERWGGKVMKTDFLWDIFVSWSSEYQSLAHSWP